MGINELASRGFDAGAGDYERARPSYPEAAVRFLVEQLGIWPGATVLDLGAGTGKMTRLLVPSGARVIAAEPVEGMRARLREALPGVAVLAATAEAIPLAGESASAVVVAQAFHWFDPEPAIREIHRVLTPGGGLGLIWNVRDESVGWMKRFSELLAPYRERARAIGAPAGSVQIAASRGMITGPWRAMLGRSPLFTPLAERRFRYDQPLPPDGVLARASSISFVSVLPEADRTTLLDAIRDLVATDPETTGRAEVIIPYVTHVFWTVKQ